MAAFATSSSHLPCSASLRQVRHRPTPSFSAVAAGVCSGLKAGERRLPLACGGTARTGRAFASPGSHPVPTPAERPAENPRPATSCPSVTVSPSKSLTAIAGEGESEPAATMPDREAESRVRAANLSPAHFSIPANLQDGEGVPRPHRLRGAAPRIGSVWTAGRRTAWGGRSGRFPVGLPAGEESRIDVPGSGDPVRGLPGSEV